MDELPHRAVVNLQPAFGEFGNQPAQGEIAHLDPFQHPDTVFARNRLRPVPSHFARHEAAGLSLPSYPSNGRADGNPELFGRLIARQPSLKEKLIKIGAKVVCHGRYVAFQMAEVAIPRQMFQEILRLIAELRPQPPPAPT